MAVTNSATQNFVPIRDIRDGVVIMKNGQMAMVLLATSINFALKSSDEQRAILRQFQAFLNTLDFSILCSVPATKYSTILRTSTITRTRPR